jgi:hypothetical protein
VARSFARAVQATQTQFRKLAGDLQRPVLSRVRALVEDEQDLVFFWGDPLLLRERPEAGADERLFVTSWDDYGGSEGWMGRRK